DDLILCQITSQSRKDRYSRTLTAKDFESGQLTVDSYARVNRLFTVEQSVIIYSAGKIRLEKLNETKAKLNFSPEQCHKSALGGSDNFPGCLEIDCNSD